MRKNRPVCLKLFFALFIFVIVLVANLVSINANTCIINDNLEEKTICSATLDDDFTDNCEIIQFKIIASYYTTLIGQVISPLFISPMVPPPPMTLITEIDTYGLFYRYYNESQNLYGFESGYDSKYTFTYQSMTYPLLNSTNFTLIDNDKLVLETIYIVSGVQVSEKIYLTRDQHYSRNTFQSSNIIYLPSTESGFRSFYSNYFTPAAFFHQLGLYDGDTSNLDNIKYTLTYNMISEDQKTPQLLSVFYKWPIASFEVIYDNNGNKDIDSLVMGTFNYFDPSNLLYIGEHWLCDVYPYLIWGNNEQDNSTILERFIWDHGSTSGESDWRMKRGSTLYNQQSPINQWITLSVIEILQERIG